MPFSPPAPQQNARRRTVPRRPLLMPLWSLLRLRRHRRVVVALCAGVATTAALLALAPPPPPTRTVLLAARDVPAGQQLRPEDVRTGAVPVELVPADALTALPPTGAPLLAGLSAREVVTRGRLAGRGVLSGLAPGELALAVPLVDSGGGQLLHAGAAVELVVAADSGTAGVVAGRLLTAPTRGATRDAALGGGDPVLTAVVAVPAAQAPAVALAAAAAALPFLLPGPVSS